MPISLGLKTSILATSGILNLAAGTHIFFLSPLLKFAASSPPPPQTEDASTQKALPHPVLRKILLAEKTRGWLHAGVGALELGVAYVGVRYPRIRHGQIDFTAMGVTFAASKIAKVVLLADVHNIASALWARWRWKRRMKSALAQKQELEDMPATALILSWCVIEMIAMGAVAFSGSWYMAGIQST